MNQYLLSIYQPTGESSEDVPSPEYLEPIMREVEAVNSELRDAGAWVFGGGLHHPSSATVVRVSDNDVLTTDGPYVEGKEHLGGFNVIQAEDLDAALEWGRKLSKAANTREREFLTARATELNP